MKVGIFGTGAYGFSLANAIIKNNHEIIMWTPFEEEKKSIESSKRVKSLPGFSVSEEMKITNSLDEVINGSDLLIVVIPAPFVDKLFYDIKDKVSDDVHICIACKGIEENTGLFIHEVLEKYIHTDNVSVISGPSFAVDLIKGSTCGLSLATKNKSSGLVVKKALENDYVRLRINEDVIGTEICGAIKNVIAIASGILDGLKASESTRAMLLTEALHDMAKIIESFGGSERTILSYAGFGDLLLTCGSIKSRNYRFGKMLGEGISKEEVNEYLENNTVEGYNTLVSMYRLLKKYEIKIPMINLIHRIVMGKCEAQTILTFLIEKE